MNSLEFASKYLDKFNFKGGLGKNDQGMSQPIAVLVRPPGAGIGTVVEASALPENIENSKRIFAKKPANNKSAASLLAESLQNPGLGSEGGEAGYDEDFANDLMRLEKKSKMLREKTKMDENKQKKREKRRKLGVSKDERRVKIVGEGGREMSDFEMSGSEGSKKEEDEMNSSENESSDEEDEEEDDEDNDINISESDREHSAIDKNAISKKEEILAEMKKIEIKMKNKRMIMEIEDEERKHLETRVLEENKAIEKLKQFQSIVKKVIDEEHTIQDKLKIISSTKKEFPEESSKFKIKQLLINSLEKYLSGHESISNSCKNIHDYPEASVFFNDLSSKHNHAVAGLLNAEDIKMIVGKILYPKFIHIIKNINKHSSNQTKISDDIYRLVVPWGPLFKDRDLKEIMHYVRKALYSCLKTWSVNDLDGASRFIMIWKSLMDVVAPNRLEEIVHKSALSNFERVLEKSITKVSNFDDLSLTCFELLKQILSWKNKGYLHEQALVALIGGVFAPDLVYAMKKTTKNSPDSMHPSVICYWSWRNLLPNYLIERYPLLRLSLVHVIKEHYEYLGASSNIFSKDLNLPRLPEDIDEAIKEIRGKRDGMSSKDKKNKSKKRNKKEEMVGPLPSLREFLGIVADDEGVLFAPDPQNRTVTADSGRGDGLQVSCKVFHFGGSTIYLFQDVVYLFDQEKNNWEPISIKDLLQRAKN